MPDTHCPLAIAELVTRLATPVVASTNSHDLQAFSNGTVQTKTVYRITIGGETNAESRDKGTHNAAEQQELPSVFAHYNASQVVQH